MECRHSTANPNRRYLAAKREASLFLSPNRRGDIPVAHWSDNISVAHWRGDILVAHWNGDILVAHWSGDILVAHWSGDILVAELQSNNPTSP